MLRVQAMNFNPLATYVKERQGKRVIRKAVLPGVSGACLRCVENRGFLRGRGEPGERVTEARSLDRIRFVMEAQLGMK